MDEDDDEESQEQNALNKEKKLKAKKLANKVEMNLCMNILLQRQVTGGSASALHYDVMYFCRFVTLERIFAYYCRCIKNEPERFKFRQSIGPKEYAIFCQECEITGEGKCKLSVIESRRVFKTANMEVWQMIGEYHAHCCCNMCCCVAACTYGAP